MYLPPLFEEKDQGKLHATIRESGLATLVTVTAAGPYASHVPMLLDPAKGPHGTLRGHIALANPQSKTMVAGAGALAIFLGPDAYISPSYYATKKQHGKVVPTWNYLAIHAAGPIRFFDDAESLLAIVTALTQKFEGQRAAPWAVSDAPADYVQTMLKAIVGFEIEIATLEGKWKMSQNQPAENKPGVVEGLRRDGLAEVADIVAERTR
ncbi:MAG TPA: FMN-binding negative transcriptional regulator [Magnetospirillaceae bacterium]|jgi:transcriptional regulator